MRSFCSIIILFLLSACAHDQQTTSRYLDSDDPVVIRAYMRATATVGQCEKKFMAKMHPTLDTITMASQSVAESCDSVAQAEAKKLRLINVHPDTIEGAIDYLTSKEERAERLMQDYFKDVYKKKIDGWTQERLSKIDKANEVVPRNIEQPSVSTTAIQRDFIQQQEQDMEKMKRQMQENKFKVQQMEIEMMNQRNNNANRGY